MYDSLIARISALGLAGIVTLSLVASIGRLADREHASAAMAQAERSPALMTAASAAPVDRL